MAIILNLKLQELSESYRKVMYYFFSFPEQHTSLNDLSKSINSSKTATKTAVMRLIKEGFLKKEIIGNAWGISADTKSMFIVTKKIPYNLWMIYESGIIAKIYNRIPNARSIILFGSYRWGTDNEKSDIDISVEILGDQTMHIETLAIFNNFGFRRNIKVNMHIFSRNKIDLNLFTNIANGIVLDGLLEVHK